MDYIIEYRLIIFYWTAIQQNPLYIIALSMFYDFFWQIATAVNAEKTIQFIKFSRLPTFD